MDMYTHRGRKNVAHIQKDDQDQEEERGSMGIVSSKEFHSKRKKDEPRNLSLSLLLGLIHKNFVHIFPQHFGLPWQPLGNHLV